MLGSNAIIFHKGLIYYTSESQHQQPNASAAEHGRVNENVVGLLHVDADCPSDHDSTNHSIRHMSGDNPCSPRVDMRFFFNLISQFYPNPRPLFSPDQRLMEKGNGARVI